MAYNRMVNGEYRERIFDDAGTIRYERYRPPDASTPEEARDATAEEAELFERDREQKRQVRARRAVSQATRNLLNHPSGLGQDLVTLFVAKEVLSPKQAMSLGWTPPSKQ